MIWLLLTAASMAANSELEAAADAFDETLEASHAAGEGCLLVPGGRVVAALTFDKGRISDLEPLREMPEATLTCLRASAAGFRHPAGSGVKWLSIYHAANSDDILVTLLQPDQQVGRRILLELDLTAALASATVTACVDRPERGVRTYAMQAQVTAAGRITEVRADNPQRISLLYGKPLWESQASADQTARCLAGQLQGVRVPGFGEDLPFQLDVKVGHSSVTPVMAQVGNLGIDR